MIFVALFWALFSLKGPCPSCAEEHRDGCCMLGPTRQESPALTPSARLLMQAWFSRFEEHTAVSTPILPSPIPSSPPAQGYSQSIHPPHCTHVKGCPNPQATHPGPSTWPSWTLLRFQQAHLPPIKGTNCTSQIDVTWKSAGGATSHCLCHIEGIKHYDSLRDTTHYCFHFVTKPLTVTPWMQPSCQFFIHQRVYPSNFLHSNLIVGMLGGDIISKAL